MTQANNFINELNQTLENVANSNMLAFCQAMGKFIKDALICFKDDEILQYHQFMDVNAHHLRLKVYDIKGTPTDKMAKRAFRSHLICLACDNHLAVYDDELKILYLPDGTQLNAQDETDNWQPCVNEQIKAWRKFVKTIPPQIPTEKKEFRQFVRRIFQKAGGKQMNDCLKRYNSSLTKLLFEWDGVRTPIMQRFSVSIGMEEKEGYGRLFKASLHLRLPENCPHLAELTPVLGGEKAINDKRHRDYDWSQRTLSMIDFYGVSEDADNIINYKEDPSKAMVWATGLVW